MSTDTMTQFDTDLAQYQAQQQKTAEDMAQLNANANSATTMMDAINLLYEMMDCIGDTLVGYADVLNMLTDGTNATAQAENDFAGMMSSAIDDPDQCADYCSDYVNQINSIETMTQQLQDTGAIDSSTADTILNSCQNIEDSFGDDWGNPTAMAGDMNTWMTDAENNGGTYPAQINDIQQAQQQIETSFSSLTQTEQYKVQEEVTVEQNLASTCSATQNSWSSMTSQMTRNQMTS